jgi:hypothetical protein
VTKTDWYESHREHFVLFTMDTRYRATGLFLISVGTLSETLVHPREVMRPAIVAGAYGMVVAHNHPSGDPTPSEADRSMTRKIRECADLFQIQLLDHLIVGEAAVTNAPVPRGAPGQPRASSTGDFAGVWLFCVTCGGGAAGLPGAASSFSPFLKLLIP